MNKNLLPLLLMLFCGSVRTYANGADEKIIITEIMAANIDQFISPATNFDDWIELYNTASEPIDIQGMYLSNDETEPLKYRISGADGVNTIIGPNDYLVVWCDNRESLSQVHAPFKLDSDGGKIVLTASDMSFTDIISYSSMSKNETIARYPDGGGIFRTNRPTIGKSNIYTSYLVEEKQIPTGINSKSSNSGSMLNILFKDGRIVIKTNIPKLNLSIVSLTGQMFWSDRFDVIGKMSSTIQGIPEGYYILNVKADGTLEHNMKVFIGKPLSYEIVYSQN